MRVNRLIILAFAVMGTVLVSCNSKGNMASEEKTEVLTLLIGTYTRGDSRSEGIYVYRFNPEDGTATYQSVVEVPNPSYLTPSSDGNFVYAVSEGKEEGALVSSFAYDKKQQQLTKINSVLAQGNAPCYLVLDEKNRFVATANYSGATVNVLPVNPDGSVAAVSQVISFEGTGLNQERQKQPHPHCVQFSPDSAYLYVPDLGTDQIHQFIVAADRDQATFLKKGEPASYKVAPGAGPRHLTFHPSGKYAYLINELSGTVNVFGYNNGNLEEKQTILADSAQAAGSADIHVSNDGKFLYASNRLENDGVVVFMINEDSGELAYAGYQSTGIHPRNFILSPDNRYLLVACRDSNRVQIFSRNPETGLLENTGNTIELDQPVCLKWI